MMRRRALISVSTAALMLAGCGDLEYRDSRFGTVSSSSTSSTATNRSSQVFINASAVIVERGDTVYALSQRHRVSARDIIVANNLKPPYTLQVGQRIVLPRGTVHTVRSGETLYRIAKAYDATVYEIARANSIGPPYTIFVDQKIRIPGTAGRTAPTTTVSSSGSTSGTSSSGSGTASGSVETASIPLPAPKPTAPKIVPTPPPATGSGFVWPTSGKVVSTFGPKGEGRFNDGINIAAPEGSPINAAENGVVAYAGNELRGFGNLVLVKHSNGYVTAYAHASELHVKRGEKVTRGQVIGRVGATGNVNSPQLHFEVRRGKTPLDPAKHLPPSSA